MSTTLEALRIGLKNTQRLLALRAQLTPPDYYPKGKVIQDQHEAECALLEEQIALLSRGHTVRAKDYSYTCGDGCCSEDGVDVFVDEKRICSVPSLEYAIEELFEHFGIDVDFRHE